MVFSIFKTILGLPAPKLQIASNGCIGLWVTFVFVRAMSSPTDIPAKFFELLSECQGLALKLWANPECKARFPRLTSMYQTVTDEGQGLFWELKVAAQERQNCYCKKLKETLLHHSPQQVMEGIREKEQQVQIHQYPYQVHKMRFQAHVRKIHQYPNQNQIEIK